MDRRTFATLLVGSIAVPRPSLKQLEGAKARTVGDAQETWRSSPWMRTAMKQSERHGCESSAVPKKATDTLETARRSWASRYCQTIEGEA